jgi:hypothetical protein
MLGTLLLVGANDAVDERLRDAVLHGGACRGGDEELVFYVHKVLRSLDQLVVGLYEHQQV